MKRVIIIMLFCCVSTSIIAQDKKKTKLSPDSLVSIIYSVLEEFSNDTTTNVPDFSSASITLETSTERTVGGGIEIFVEVGVEAAKSKTTKVTYNIARKKSPVELLAQEMFFNKGNDKSIDGKDIKLLLAQEEKRRRERRRNSLSVVNLNSELITFLKKVSEDYKKITARTNKQYETSSFEIEISFEVTKTADGKLGFSLADNIGIEIGGSTSKKNVHTIAIKYGE